MRFRSKLFVITLLYGAVQASAQNTYADSIFLFQKAYKEDFIKEPRSPLKEKDTAGIRFYAPNKEFRLWASLALTPEAPEFDLLTHNGTKRRYRQYAIATFQIKGKKHKLSIYQNISMLAKEEHKNHLFLPFNDHTNYRSTYAGGRYLDLNIKDIIDGNILIDFNKCYNPYCAYKEGYACPIPPSENRLKIKVEAGEQLFVDKISE